MSNELITVNESPIEAVPSEKVKLMAERVRVLVPDGHKLSPAQALTIAQLSILTRTLPGRDVHYFLDAQGNLKQSDDYKFLRAWAIRREQFVTGDPAASFEDVYDELDEAAKLREGISPNDFAVFCTITTKRERDNFRSEVKGWLDLGFKPDKAIEMAREVLGVTGTRAIGVINANDASDNNRDRKITKGWSPLQKARKLAFKNAVRLKWGQPSIDDTQAMVRAMARGEIIEGDWDEVPADVSSEEQARYAELNAIKRHVETESAGLTTEQRQARNGGNITLMRGDKDSPIGESDWELFVSRVKKRIPFYTSEKQITEALGSLAYSVENEELCFDAVAKYASSKADIQADMFTGQRLAA